MNKSIFFYKYLILNIINNIYYTMITIFSNIYKYFKYLIIGNNNNKMFPFTDIENKPVSLLNKKNKYDSIIFTIFGYLFKYIISPFMLTGKKAIIYYAEAHLSKFNSYIHTIFMPFSILGILIWLSALFKLTPNMAKYFMWKLYYFYGGLYLNINPANTLVYYIIYYFVTYKASIYYNKCYNKYIYTSLFSWKYNGNSYIYTRLFIIGFFISFISLTIQEIIGHKYGNDIPSRLSGVPNAILYAKYFSISHFFND